MNGTLQKNVLSDQKNMSFGLKKTYVICHMFLMCMYICCFIIFDESLTKAIWTFPKRCPETIPRGTSQALEALKAVQPPIVHAQQMLSVPGNPTDQCCHVKSTGPQKTNGTESLQKKTLTNPEILLSSFTTFDQPQTFHQQILLAQPVSQWCT